MQGDVSTFLNALDSGEEDAPLAQALALVGGGEPQIETYDDDDQVETYLSVPEQGVSFLLNDGELDTGFIRATTTDTQTAYTGWASLMDGADADSSREDLECTFGSPLRATDSFAVSILLPAIEA